MKQEDQLTKFFTNDCLKDIGDIITKYLPANDIINLSKCSWNFLRFYNDSTTWIRRWKSRFCLKRPHDQKWFKFALTVKQQNPKMYPYMAQFFKLNELHNMEFGLPSASHPAKLFGNAILRESLNDRSRKNHLFLPAQEFFKYINPEDIKMHFELSYPDEELNGEAFYDVYMKNGYDRRKLYFRAKRRLYDKNDEMWTKPGFLFLVSAIGLKHRGGRRYGWEVDSITEMDGFQHLFTNDEEMDTTDDSSFE